MPVFLPSPEVVALAPAFPPYREEVALVQPCRPLKGEEELPPALMLASLAVEVLVWAAQLAVEGLLWEALLAVEELQMVGRLVGEGL